MPDRHRGPGRSGLLLLLATANRYGYHREVESAATACPVRPVPSSRAIVATSTTTSAIATLREAPEQRRQRRLVVVTPGWVLRGDAEVQLVWLFGETPRGLRVVSAVRRPRPGGQATTRRETRRCDTTG